MSFSTGVIPTTSVSRPQLKSSPHGDRVMHNNSRGKKLEVEEHHRNVKLPKNKTSVTVCNDSLNAKTLNVKSVSAMCDKCVLIDKHDMCVLKSVAKPFKETVALESNKKPRNNVRKLYERLRKIYKCSYINFTPLGYMWKPKSPTGNVNPNLVEIILFIVDSGCSKYMTRNLKLLINLVEKFLGTVKLHLFLDMTMALEHNSLCLERKCQENVSHGDKTVTMINELDLLFSPMFDELLNGPSQVVSKSSDVTTADECIQRQQLTTPLNNHTTPAPTCQIQSIAPTVISSENINQAETHAENDQGADDEFINIFSTSVQEQGETSSRHVDSLNM
nr:hypothetical protein [Tanacetum cinerariifolium]